MKVIFQKNILKSLKLPPSKKIIKNYYSLEPDMMFG